MRIIVSKLDLSQGRFTKVARALQKAWPLESLSLMQAQEKTASFLGYRNFHDLQQQAVPEITSDIAKAISRNDIANATAWRIFRRYGISPLDAAAIVSKMHLNRLEIDFFTIEGAFEQTQKEQRKNGRFLLVDEAWSLLNQPWNPKTPAMLDANIPGYSYAVFPDGRMFRWSQLERQVSALPKDFAEELRNERNYADCDSDAERELRFIANELYPHACAPVVEAMKDGQILPNGFRITWVFSEDGICLGRVLNNVAIGGILPVLFSVDGDDLYETAARILCGERISAPEKAEGADSFPAYKLKYEYGGFDLERDIKSASGIHAPPDYMKIRGDICYQYVGESIVLAGECFEESGQVYLRNQKWIEMDVIGDYILSQPTKEDFIAKGLSTKDKGTLPAFFIGLHNLAKEQLQLRFKNAEQYVSSDNGAAKLLSCLPGLVKAEVFDAFCVTEIDQYLPTRNSDDTEDSDYLIEERKEGLDRLSWLGKESKVAVPELACYQDVSVGFAMMLANSEYPGSRHSSMVYPPSNAVETGGLLAGMVFVAACATNRLALNDETMQSRPLALVVHDIAEGFADPALALANMRLVQKFWRRLEAQSTFLKGVNDWREVQEQMQSIRKGAQFLAVGDPIGRERPKGLNELFSMARSSNFVPIMATQTFSDLKKPD